MFLSRVWIEPYDKRQLSILSDCYAAHKLVAAACGSMKNGRRPLFRPEAGEIGNSYLLVQSDIEPDWGRAEEFIGTSLSAECKPFKFPSLDAETRLRFRLRANPIKTIRGGTDEARDARGNLKRIRVPLKTEDAQREWLRRKLRDAGSDLEGVVVRQEGEVVGRPRKSRSSIKLFSVQFDGTLRVHDPESFIASLSSGIGPGKGFGFGLMSIASQ